MIKQLIQLTHGEQHVKTSFFKCIFWHNINFNPYGGILMIVFISAFKDDNSLDENLRLNYDMFSLLCDIGASFEQVTARYNGMHELSFKVNTLASDNVGMKQLLNLASQFNQTCILAIETTSIWRECKVIYDQLGITQLVGTAVLSTNKPIDEDYTYIPSKRLYLTVKNDEVDNG
jgi:hypothetical protein